MTTASLPQDATFPLLRNVESRVARLRYRYRHGEDNGLRPVAAAKCFPILREIYNPSWALRHIPLVLASTVNRAVKMPLVKYLDRRRSPWSLEPFDVIPGFYHRPPADSRAYRDDGYFAFRRVGGACPTVISRITSAAELAAKVPTLTDADFQAATGATTTLADAIAANRLFVADYVRLQEALRPQHPSNDRDSRYRDKYLPAPVLVMYERPASGSTPDDLVPVAITADQPGTTPNPMFLPADGDAWQIAKTYVEVADNNWHFGIGHLYRCHFMMEAFSLATKRNLPCQHPLRMLLDPHLRFTLFTNVVAYSYFTNTNQLYDRMYAGTLEESRALFTSSVVAGDSALDLLPTRDLAARNMDVGLARYPWREDALRWESIARDYVTRVVNVYYANDAAVTADSEVVAFATELRSPSFANVPGVFATIDRASLIEALTLAVYTAGAGHSAMHFPMIDLYTYAPTQCESAWSPPIRTQAEGTPTRFRQTLPPVTEALENYYQVEIGHFRYDVFGDFRDYAIGSLDAVRPAVDALTTDLAALAASIDARESTAPPRRGYPYLHPSLVTNSVNI
ncbi:MAG: hypothetical protein H6726_29980 [Sandaracinaceae bacterium]|nr:hypothetical protein [Sandaracinaceae bacterium]